jgi:hypothetical protein
MPEVHLTETVSDFLGDTWTAMCSCGWVGNRHKSILDASKDCYVHRCDVELKAATPSKEG